MARGTGEEHVELPTYDSGEIQQIISGDLAKIGLHDPTRKIQLMGAREQGLKLSGDPKVESRSDETEACPARACKEVDGGGSGCPGCDG